MPRIKAASEIAIRDRDSGARRMNEAASSRIDAHVIDAAFANAKEHQVPGRKLRDRHRVRGPGIVAIVRGEPGSVLPATPAAAGCMGADPRAGMTAGAGAGGCGAIAGRAAWRTIGGEAAGGAVRTTGGAACTTGTRVGAGGVTSGRCAARGAVEATGTRAETRGA